MPPPSAWYLTWAMRRSPRYLYRHGSSDQDEGILSSSLPVQGDVEGITWGKKTRVGVNVPNELHVLVSKVSGTTVRDEICRFDDGRDASAGRDWSNTVAVQGYSPLRGNLLLSDSWSLTRCSEPWRRRCPFSKPSSAREASR